MNGGTSQYEITKYDGACAGKAEETYKVSTTNTAMKVLCILFLTKAKEWKDQNTGIIIPHLQIDFDSKAVSRLVIIATEDKFLVWSTKATRAKNIEIPYTITTPANEETEAEAVYSKDYLAIKVTQLGGPLQCSGLVLILHFYPYVYPHPS